MKDNLKDAIDNRKEGKTEEEAKEEFIDAMQQWNDFMSSNGKKWWGGKAENISLENAIGKIKSESGGGEGSIVSEEFPRNVRESKKY